MLWSTHQIEHQQQSKSYVMASEVVLDISGHQWGDGGDGRAKLKASTTKCPLHYFVTPRLHKLFFLSLSPIITDAELWPVGKDVFVFLELCDYWSLIICRKRERKGRD